jgi:hypothetical protein
MLFESRINLGTFFFVLKGLKFILVLCEIEHIDKFIYL